MRNLSLDRWLKFGHSPVVTSVATPQNAVGTTTSTTLRTLDYTPSDANSIFVKSDGDDDTGSGTQAAPYKTIDHAIDQLDASHQKIVLMDAGPFEIEGREITGNFKGLYAASGVAPVVTVNPASDHSIYTDTETIKTETLGGVTDGAGFTKGGEFHELTTGNCGFVLHYMTDSGPSGQPYVYHKCIEPFTGSVVTAAHAITGAECTVYSSCYLPGDSIFVPYLKRSGGIYTYNYIVIDGQSGDNKISEKLLGSGNNQVRSCCYLKNSGYVAYVRRPNSDKSQLYIHVIDPNTGTNKYGGFKIVDEAGVIADASISYIAADKVIVSWEYNGTLYYLIVNPTDGSEYKTRTVLESSVTSYSRVAVKPLPVDNLILVAKGYMSENAQYKIFDYNDDSDITSFENVLTHSSYFEVNISILDNGCWIVECSGYYKIIARYFQYLKVSTAFIANGVELTPAGTSYYDVLFQQTAKITAKYVDIHDVVQPIDYAESYVFKGAAEVDFQNSIIKDSRICFDLETDTFTFKNSQIARCYGGYPVQIDGAAAAAGDIIFDHFDIFNCYAGLRLENNNGANETIKNGIFHSLADYSIYADTDVTYSYCVDTGETSGGVEGSSVLNSNPLYINEGAISEDDMDLNIKLRDLGYKNTSPAYGLADDDRNAGALDVDYTFTETSRSYITVPKHLITVDVVPVMAVNNQHGDGSGSFDKSAMSEVFTFTWKGLIVEYFDDLMSMLYSDDDSVYVYFNPDSEPTTYIELSMSWDGVPASPEYPSQSDLGVNRTFTITGTRAYEVVS